MSDGRFPVDPAGSTWTAVVLAGGRARRFGGQAKPQAVLDGRTLLAHVVDAIPAEVAVVVVGPAQPVPRAVRLCREDPPFGGPVAALAAAVDLVETDAMGLIAADMPYAGTVLVDLARRWRGEDALIPIDHDGRRQPLCSVLSTTAVRRALAAVASAGDGAGQGAVAGRSLHSLLAHLTVTEIPLAPDKRRALVDIDEPQDLVDRGPRG